jgi:hypothetical protein
MIQMRCPRCGNTIAFSAHQSKAQCGRCQHEIAIDGPAPAARAFKDPEQDSAIVSAMKTLGLVIAAIFALPVLIGFLRGQTMGEGVCQITSTPSGAPVFEGETFLGKTPLELSPYYKEQRVLSLRYPGGEISFSLAADASSCDRLLTLP